MFHVVNNHLKTKATICATKNKAEQEEPSSPQRVSEVDNYQNTKRFGFIVTQREMTQDPTNQKQLADVNLRR
jgi:hypothetical protein